MQFCMAAILAIAFLLSSSPRLPAAIMSSVPSKGDTAAQRGETGVRSQEGEQVETSQIPINNQVAFTMRRSSSFISNFEEEHLPFEDFVTLLPDTNVDLATGTFTCHVPGIYVFMFSVLKAGPSPFVYIYLRKNNNVVVTGISTGLNDGEEVAGSAVLSLEHGDLVYLTVRGTLYDSPDHFSSFSGFLLYNV